MPTTIIHLEGEFRDSLNDLYLATYLDGACYPLAIALHQGLGWDILGLMVGNIIRHACVINPEGKLFDARGFVEEKDFGEPFGYSLPYPLKKISVDDLLKTDGLETGAAFKVASARRMAEILYPKLPWKESFAKRAEAFADDLETLSQKHGLWVIGRIPGQAPLLAPHVGDEKGYALSPTADGNMFSINRLLPEQ